MKKITCFLCVGFLLLSITLYGQSSISLSFTCINDQQHIEADSLLVINTSQGGDTLLYYPDTVLEIGGTISMGEIASSFNNFELYQNYPNPFSNNTMFEINLPSDGKLNIDIVNTIGQVVASFNDYLPEGMHQYSFKSGKERIYIVNARYKGFSKTIKIIQFDSRVDNCELEYTGLVLKNAIQKSLNYTNGFAFTPGDKLLIIAYNSQIQSGCYDMPVSDTTYQFQFASNIPCPGIDSLEYEGQYYKTVQVFNQCWMKENLNVGEQLAASSPQTDNGIIEKYCLLNDLVQCDRYGGVYMWDELMNYAIQDGAQGICPEGWHVASDDDFKILEGAIDSYYDIGDPVWDNFNTNGTDVGTKLKSTDGWYNGGNGTDDFGFSALWGGYLYLGNWAGGNLLSTFFTSTQDASRSNMAIDRSFSWMWSASGRGSELKSHARPVRCVKD